MELYGHREGLLSQIFQDHLAEFKGTSGNIYVLGIGDGKELIPLRAVLGESARIYGIDIQSSAKARSICDSVGADFLKADMKGVGDIVGRHGSPELVICRAPAMYNGISEEGNPIIQNKWYPAVLANWFGQLKTGGKLLVITLVRLDLEMIRSYFEHKNLGKWTESSSLGSNVIHKPCSLESRLQVQTDGYVFCATL